MLVLTETGAQNAGDFDGTDSPPNSYNGGGPASCVNSGVLPDVRVTIGGTSTDYQDSGPVLKGGGGGRAHPPTRAAPAAAPPAPTTTGTPSATATPGAARFVGRVGSATVPTGGTSISIP